MSDTPPPVLPPIPTPDQPRSGCLTAFMIISGLVLLFPGLCFLAFGSDGSAFGLIGLILIGVAMFLFFRAAKPLARRQ